jgi:uncharacterized membrane protein
MPASLSKVIVIILATFSLIGFFDSAYLTAEHYAGGVPPCIIGSGCGIVTTSSYSTVFGIPVAAAGVAYYLALFLFSVGLFSGSIGNLKKIFILSALGFLATLYFVSLQLFVIKAICTYCMISAVTTTIIFLTSFYTRRELKRQTKI